ncbi:WecB/TagA/CpsF family glycosyltransferase [Frankia sp. AgB1.9]|uniref:WecB/TagA/CpsF family glycosyltransferase n=1 Tax=unclassified Frankia TaxID=2632575 RepID=UPI00193200CE|nr:MULTISPECIES: WecB/TagA/CpsF family glycosyltransferase [unclassified Frankia]MBL7494268.1 WecB/TagA/CpsF family glycosyltransferase [Frankia sp. AgW1.1]MBL7553596.1 WecB/TagA/CpsF family glycosyltransferase [Frankia sp. AgB1.9]MBL7620640.1 WecB/TagA/CpsF family glycosyltransferase [Frankia sp. AgB1.8]
MLEGGTEPRTATGTRRSAPVIREASCCGVRITACSFEDAVAAVIGIPGKGDDEVLGTGTGAAIHLCNAYTLALADRDARLKSTLNTARFNFPDGWPVARLTRQRTRLSGANSQKISGPDLFQAVLSAGRDHDVKHYFLGSTPEVLEALERSVRKAYPGVQIAGVESPPFRELTPEERAEQRLRIIASGADLVWVGLGTPKQDWEVERLAAEIPAVFLAVGAAFDFLAGLKPRAPRWMGDYGVEWIFRLVSEPKRLWKRYLVGNPQFILSVLRNRGH